MPPALAGWAEELAAADGDTPLVGTGRRAARYEALLWSAARHPDDPELITALLTRSPGRDAEALDAALAAGAAARAQVAVPDGPARPDTAVLSCAVVAALVSDAPSTDLGAVLDVAASLMLLDASAAIAGSERLRLVRAGHPAAAGWLAARCVRAGVTGLADGVFRTVAVVTGVEPTQRPLDAMIAAIS